MRGVDAPTKSPNSPLSGPLETPAHLPHLHAPIHIRCAKASAVPVFSQFFLISRWFPQLVRVHLPKNTIEVSASRECYCRFRSHPGDAKGPHMCTSNPSRSWSRAESLSAESTATCCFQARELHRLGIRAPGFHLRGPIDSLRSAKERTAQRLSHMGT